MRILLSLTLLWLGLAWGQTVSPAGPPPAPEEVLQFLSGMGFSPEFTAALTSTLSAGFKSGRTTTTVTLLLLQDLTKVPRDQAEQALEIVRYALSQGFIVDTGLTGSSMLNEVRKLLTLGRDWEEVLRILSLRLGFLLATRSVLGRHGLITVGALGPEVPLTSADRLVLELSWAVGDFILWEGGSASDPRFLGYVQGRLNRLVALGVLCSEDTGRVTAALTPTLLEEIVQLVFQPERR